MGDYHFIYKDVEGSSTQWDDIQRKLGNLPPKSAPFKPEPFTPAQDPDLQPKSKSWIDERTAEELSDLEDDPDLDDNRFLQEYRKKRMEELKATTRVTQEPQDVWVVVLLYKDGYPDCVLLLRCLEELATRYPATKFVKIISTYCIPNYPDYNLPTILVYNNGIVKGTYVGLRHFSSRKCTPESVALALCQSDPVLNDGRSEGASKDAVIQGVCQKFIEKAVDDQENIDDDYSSD